MCTGERPIIRQLVACAANQGGCHQQQGCGPEGAVHYLSN